MNKTSLKPGFTLVELLVLLVLVSMVTVVLFSIVLNFYKARKKAQILDELQGTTSLVFNRLIQDIHWSESYALVPGVDYDELTLTHLENELPVSVTYKVDGGRLYLDGNSITSERTFFKSFSVEEVSGGAEVPCFKVVLEVEYSGYRPVEVLTDEIVVSLRKTDINVP